MKITRQDILCFENKIFALEILLRKWSAIAMVNHPLLQRIKKQDRKKHLKLIQAEIAFQIKVLKESSAIAKESLEKFNGEILSPIPDSRNSKNVLK